jgi:uncharacterized protein YjiS (DUF1127 family)
MEGAMPKQNMEFPDFNRRRVNPADYSGTQHLVIARAKALRAEFLRELWRQITCWYQQRAALAQLSALDDAALKDIGLHRSGIEAAVVNALTPPSPQKREAFAEKPHLCLQRTG